MLRLCLLQRCMPIGVACRTLGFQTPPTTKRELKKRFVKLTKEHHPDLHADNEKAATERMVQLTQAYTCLKKVIEHGVHYKANAAGARGAAAEGGNDKASASAGQEAEWEEVAASFRAPGSSLSLRGFTLPWQRTSSSTVVAAMESKLQEPDISFRDFVAFTRQLEKDRVHRETRIRDDAPTGDGTHGFTSDYFENTQKNSEARRGVVEDGVHGRTSMQMARLGVFYYGRRLRRLAAEAPRKAWHTIRYVFLGH